MGAKTSIQWAHRTFNPWIGCTRVGPECDHCYAAISTPARTLGIAWGPGEKRHRTRPETWHAVRRWNQEAKDTGRRDRVFCASLADVFDGEVEPGWRGDLWSLIDECRALDWLLLTKRIGNARRMLPWTAIPWPHVSIGISVGTQRGADAEIPLLKRTPAARRFLSMEPILERVSLRLHLEDQAHEPTYCGPLIDWIIVGGESGPHARETSVEWIADVVAQGKDACVPVFVKQIGARPVQFIRRQTEPVEIRISDDKGGNSSDWPADLRVREFPNFTPNVSPR